MELYFLDNHFNVTEILDGFTSVVWSESFFEVGTFTLHFPAALLPRVKDAVYVRTSFADENVKCGRIEAYRTDSDGDCKMSGHLLEILLSDRVLEGEGTYSGVITEALLDAVEENLRSSDVLISSEQPLIPEEASFSFHYDKLGDWLRSSLKPHGASFRVTLDRDSNRPTFAIVIGDDRTTDSGENGIAVFSSSFGNILSLEIENNQAGDKNYAYIEGSDGTVVGVGEAEPANRRETYLKASDIRPTDFETDDDYRAALQQRGTETLASLKGGMHVYAECAPLALPEYGRDYFLGDLCDVCDNTLALSFSLRLTAVDTVYENGTKTVYPHFGNEVRSFKNLVMQL